MRGAGVVALGVTVALGCGVAVAQEGGGLPSEPPQVGGRSARSASEVERSWLEQVAGGLSGEVPSGIEIADAVKWALERYEGTIRSSHGDVWRRPAGQGNLSDLATFLADHGSATPRGIYDAFVTGQEYALYQAILRRAGRGPGPGLTLGEVLLLSLELNGGDAFAALLTAHTTLRALARGKEGTGLLDQGPPGSDFGGNRGVDPAFFSRLERISNSSDPDGDWYHLFGAAVATLAGSAVVGADLSAAGVGVAIVGGEELGVSGDLLRDPQESLVDLAGTALGRTVAREVGRRTLGERIDRAVEGVVGAFRRLGGGEE